jgi:4-hydroxy-tetrahydrodipicolinate synthase
MNTLKKLQGIIPPMVTPLLDRDTLDTEGLERLIEHIIAGGVHGLFLLGTTGEAPSLSYKLRYELIEKATARINSRVPVLVGISDTSFTESINVAKKAADCGADAVVLAPPYYFTAGQPELIEYVEHLCDELPLPMYLYNMPGCTKINLEPKTIVELSRLEKIIGLKDSSGNLTYFNTVKTLLAGRADGGVNGGANLFPTLYVELYNASVAGDLAKVRELHAKVMGISTTIYRVGQYGSSFMKGVKCALKIKGICSDYMEEPFHRFRPAEAEKIRQFLEEEFGGQ